MGVTGRSRHGGDPFGPSRPNGREFLLFVPSSAPCQEMGKFLLWSVIFREFEDARNALSSPENLHCIKCMRMRKGPRSEASVEVLLGKVLCRHLRNPRSPLQMNPLPPAELWQERGLLGDSHPALPPSIKQRPGHHTEKW